jgi:hypothetical protein
VKPVQPSMDPAVIPAAARLLEEDPAISNLRMLQRLAHRFGPKLTQAVHVTRVERWIREPALLLIRTGALNGRAAGRPAGSEDVPAGSEVVPAGAEVVPAEANVSRSAGTSGETRKGPAPSTDPAPRRTPRRRRIGDARMARDVEDALVKAFALGAAAETPVEIVDAFRKLDDVRRKLRTRLAD